MFVMEYGEKNAETVVLVHGGGLSWWNFREAAEKFQHEYHVVLPVLDGHAESDCEFSSIADAAEKLIAYIDQRFRGHVALIGGVSLGAQVLTEMLARRPDICRCALIESALALPMPLTRALVGPMLDVSYGLICRRWFARMQAASLGIGAELFEEYYRDSCSISKESMKAMLKANASYSARPELAQAGARVLICAGGREIPVMRRSARLLHRMIPGSEVRIIKGMKHGEFSLNHAEAYAQTVRKLLSEQD